MKVGSNSIVGNHAMDSHSISDGASYTGNCCVPKQGVQSTTLMPWKPHERQQRAGREYVNGPLLVLRLSDFRGPLAKMLPTFSGLSLKLFTKVGRCQGVSVDYVS